MISKIKAKKWLEEIVIKKPTNHFCDWAEL
jgi:hypothetical protein